MNQRNHRSKLPRSHSRNTPTNRHLRGLLARVIPALVLCVGTSYLMTTWNIGTAQAQFSVPNGGFSAPPGSLAPNGRAPNGQASVNSPQFSNQTFQGSQFNTAPSQPAFRTAMQPGGQPAPGGIPEIPAAGPATQAIGGDVSAENAEESESSSWLQMPAIVTKFMSGGWLMLPLGICSLVVLSLSFERLIALRRSRVIPKPFVRRFTECVEDGVLSYEEATELCEEFDCPVSEVFRAALRRWGRPMFEIEQAVMDAGDRVSDGLRRYLRVFHAISNVAPLIGLLGTVIGMIDAFEVISDQATIGRPEMLASGISMALMTTAGGLSVAIPAYLAYMYFSSKSDRFLGEIERLCGRVIDCISAEGLEENTSSTRKKRKAA